MDIKYLLLLTLIAFSDELSHCLQPSKICNPYPKTVENCEIGIGNQRLKCKENYSLFNQLKCINFPNCNYFNEEEKCT